MHIHIISLFLLFLPWLHIMIYGNHDLHPPTPPLNVPFFRATSGDEFMELARWIPASRGFLEASSRVKLQVLHGFNTY